MIAGHYQSVSAALAGLLLAGAAACAGTNDVCVETPTNGIPSVADTNAPPLTVETNAVSSGDSTNMAAAEPSLWFPVGEELTYRIYWGFIPVGKARVLTRWIEEDGKRLIAIRYRTRNNKVLATLYPVDDVMESIVDPETFLPVRFTMKLREGGYRAHEVTTFDYETKTAHWKSLRNGDTKEYEIDDDTRDIVTFMFYMRAHRFQMKETKTFRVMADEKLYDLMIRAEGFEDIGLKAFGKIRSLKLVPQAKFKGLFVRKGKMVLWVSDDDRFITTRVKVSVPVANVTVVLAEVRGPGDDRWVRKTEEYFGKDRSNDDPEVDRALGQLDEEVIQ